MWDFSFYLFISLIEVIFIKRLFLISITLLLSFILLSFETLPTTLKGEITSGYGNRINPITGKKEFHNAVDIAAEKGTPILSPVKSTVTQVENDAIYGIFVKTENEEYQFRFCHLSETSLKVGDTLKVGDEIGKVGDTGWVTGAHLHLEVMKNGEYINPKKVLSFK